jgi:hypothetical protein
MNFRRFTTAVLVLLALAPAIRLKAANESPLEVVKTYLDQVASGNYESATDLWSVASADRAGRFGIVYPESPIRADAASPLIRHAAELTQFAIQPIQSVETVGEDASCVKMLFSATRSGVTYQQWYYAKHEGEWYWLCYPQDAIARSWPVQESRFFRIHYHPTVAKYVSAPALRQFDSFVEAVADSLGLTRTDIALIADKKIEYFYCQDDSTVLSITGQFTKGVLDQSSNDIISSSFPHHHEVVHLLANIRLKTLPLYTLPVLREGLAVRFGGRWGKGPAALLDLGAFLHRDTLVSVDSTLAVGNFESSSEVDLMYPVSGVVASYLWDRLGKQKFWNLYLALSGPQEEIGKLKPAEIQAQIATALGKKSWGDVMTDLNVYTGQQNAAWATASAGTSAKGKAIWNNARDSVLIDGDWICFSVQADSGTLIRESFLLFKDTTFGDHTSVLFDEHFMGGVKFEGYRYGVRIDQNEAGVYDYAGNMLTGKFILGISGLDNYYDLKANKVTIKFKKSLFGKFTPGPGDITVVPY